MAAVQSSWPTANGAEFSVTDDRGRVVSLQSAATRVVTLAPSLAELAYGAGAGGKLVGVASYTDFPPEVRKLPRIGDASRIDLERLIALKPDLILAWKTGNQPSDIERLERMGFKVATLEPATLSAIPRSLRLIGRLTDSARVASAAAEAFEREAAALFGRYGVLAEVPVFYEIWHQPLMTVNASHMISDVLRLCGGRNVFAGAPVLTPVVSLESVIAARPEVVLGGSSAISAQEFVANWRRHHDFAGLAQLGARFIDPDLIQRQTPRVLQGARQVCEHLQAVRNARGVRGGAGSSPVFALLPVDISDASMAIEHPRQHK